MLFKVTPVSIPNTKVKLLEADGTAWETVWESKWLPGLYGSLAQSVEHMTFNHGVRSSNLRWVTKFFQKVTEKQFLGDFFVYESRKCYESGQTFRGRLSVTG